MAREDEEILVFINYKRSAVFGFLTTGMSYCDKTFKRRFIIKCLETKIGRICCGSSVTGKILGDLMDEWGHQPTWSSEEGQAVGGWSVWFRTHRVEVPTACAGRTG